MARGLSGQSPANVTAHLRGVDFPANRQDLLNQAKNNGAEQDVLEVIKNLPDNEYRTMADVTKAYNKAA